MGVANQRTIYIQRTSDKATQNYLKVSNENLNKAVRDLDGKSFKLYIYLVDNSNGFRVEMYHTHFCQWANLSESSYRRAWAELEEKGYIIKSEKKDNVYLFREASNTYQERNGKKEDVIKTVGKEELDKIKEMYFWYFNSQIESQN